MLSRSNPDNAAREGARYAVANTNTQNTAMIQNTVVQYLAGQTFTGFWRQRLQCGRCGGYTGESGDGRANDTRQQLV